MVGSVTRENSIESHNVPLSVCLSFLFACVSVRAPTADDARGTVPLPVY